MTPTRRRGGARPADHGNRPADTRPSSPARAQPQPTIASAGTAVVELRARRQTDWGGDDARGGLVRRWPSTPQPRGGAGDNAVDESAGLLAQQRPRLGEVDRTLFIITVCTTQI